MYKKILVGLITGFISGLLATGGGLILLQHVRIFLNLMKKNQEQQQYFPCL